jgi:hypothetical protein
MSSWKNQQFPFLSPIPEQRTRRGRSRSAREVPPPHLPILPPFSDTYVEKVKVSSKKESNRHGKKDKITTEQHVKEESRHDEIFTSQNQLEPCRSTSLLSDSVTREEVGSVNEESRCKENDEVLRSAIASWRKSESSRLIATRPCRDDDTQPLDIITTPSDEKSCFDRKRRERVRYSDGRSNELDKSTRDFGNRLRARARQRKMQPTERYIEESKLDLKQLRAARIKVVRGLYHTNTNASESTTMKTSNDDLSSALSSYRGKCFDKMMYLLNDVASLEKIDVPCSFDEGTSSSALMSVAELKLIKKSFRRCAFPEEIVDTDTIACKLSDVTSPTIHDGFELDEIPHFPGIAAAKKMIVSNAFLSEREHLPSLTEENESSEDLQASCENSESLNEIDMQRESQRQSSLGTINQAGVGTNSSVVSLQRNDDRKIMHETKPTVKRVTFSDPIKTEAILQKNCCIIM